MSMLTSHSVVTRVGVRAVSFLTRINFRQWLLISTVLFCILPVHLNRYTLLDRVQLYIEARLSGIQRGPAETAIVAVPDDLMASWERDFYDTDALSAILANILHASTADIALLLPQPLALAPNALDTEVAESPSTASEAVRLVQKKRYLEALLTDPRVHVGLLPEPRQRHSLEPNSAIAEFSQRADWFQHRWFYACRYCVDEEQALSVMLVLRERVPALFWRHPGGQQPGLLATLLADDEISLPPGRFVAAHRELSGYHARTINLDVVEAKLVSAFPQTVIIGPSSQAEALQALADMHYSLLHQQAYAQLPWAEYVLRGLLVLVTLYLCYLHYRWRLRAWRFSVLGAGAALLIGSSLYLALAMSLWLSVTIVLIWGTLINVLMGFWLRLREQHRARERHLSEALIEGAYILDEQRYLAQAINLLAHHPDPDSRAARIQQLSDKLVQAGETEQAIALLASTVELSNGDARLRDRLRTLRATRGGIGPLAQTQARSDAPRANDMPDMLGRYQLQNELGRGAAGIVYLAYDPVIAREVAVKALDSSRFTDEQADGLRARFFREAEAAGRLMHPNIVAVYDVGEERDLAYIAMDYVPGRPLSDFVSAESLLPAATVYRIVYEVALALAYAHEKLIVHRDIKPGNVMFVEEPFTVKVADFGIARLLDNSRTSTGEILGSPLYMAPEQLRGARVGPTADIFSLGVTFYQLLSGSLPFNGDNLASLTYEIIHNKHRSVRSVRKDLPASAARIVNQCLQKAPNDRYESAAELAVVLKKAIKRDFPAEARRYGIV